MPKPAEIESPSVTYVPMALRPPELEPLLDELDPELVVDPELDVDPLDVPPPVLPEVVADDPVPPVPLLAFSALPPQATSAKDTSEQTKIERCMGASG
jgi:hypothetical protein